MALVRFEYDFFSCIETLQEATSRLQKRRKISVNFYFRTSQKSVAERQIKSIFMLFQREFFLYIPMGKTID